MAITTAQEKFTHELGDVYDAEHQFLDAMRQAEQQATNQQLKSGIQQHIQQTEGQIQRLEQVFQQLGQRPERVSCPGAKGIVSEAQKNMKEAGNSAIRDALIDGGLDKSEHYEIASYTALVTGARLMGENRVVSLLQENLQQEQQMAQQLEQLAQQLGQEVMQASQSGSSSHASQQTS